MKRQGWLFLAARRRRAKRILQRRLGSVVGALAVALAGCLVTLVSLVARTGAPAPPRAPARLGPVVIEVTAEGFRPSVILVQPGVAVRWIFVEGEHSVADLQGHWDSGTRSGGWFEIALEEGGEEASCIEYLCRLHHRRGSIYLLPAPEADGEDGL